MPAEVLDTWEWSGVDFDGSTAFFPAAHLQCVFGHQWTWIGEGVREP